MAQYSRELHELFTPVVESMGYEVVGVEYHPNSKNRLVRVYIDREDGITVDDCAEVSHQVSGLLDVEEPISGTYTLEVSSPGLNRPLFLLAHFRQFVGAKVALKLIRPVVDHAGRKLTGMIVAVEGDSVLIAIGDKRLAVPYELIDSARLVPEW